MKLNPSQITKLILFSFLLLIAITNYYWHRFGGWQLPRPLYKERVVVIGRIASLPQQSSLGASFLLQTERIDGKPVDTKIRLTGYVFKDSKTKFSVGDRWQFITHLKPIHGLHNFDGFDYARYLALQGVRATGYIVVNSDNRCLLEDPYYYPLLRLRQSIQEKIENSLASFPEQAAIISALTVGSTTSMTNDQWQVFRLTGTSHLVAISGLHIGLMAALGFFLFRLIGKIFPKLLLRITSPNLAAIGGSLFALIYSALAGFAWPTQRALIMVLTLSLTQLFYRDMPLWRRLSLALIMILVIEPWGIFSASFGLSFCAVACLCYGLGGRWKAMKSLKQIWQMQWVIFVGLLPISLFYFKQISLVMLIANFVAIPWVAWLVVPISLAACFSLLFSDCVAHYLLVSAAYLLKWLWIFLAYLSQVSWAAWHHWLGDFWLLLILSAAALLLIAPRGIPARALAFIWLGLLLFYQPPKPKLNEWWLTLLDVGQGLALVIQTADHVMVYDTGVRYPGAFDAGRDVVVPFLESRAIQDVDLLVISHGDNDHSGGAEAIVKAVNVKQIISSIPSKFKRWWVEPCMVGQEWHWDGVDFKVLSPPPGLPYQGNNNSCVIRVSGAQHSALLTGDIQRETEHYLLSEQRADLSATVLVVPHHGSLSSSIEPFVREVKAEFTLFATGFLNRYRFPNPKVVSLYRRYHAKLYSSARDGAIELRFKANGQLSVKTVVKNKNGSEL